MRTVNELKMLARKFKRTDIGEIRISRDHKLEATSGYLWRRWREGDWMRFVGKADKGNWARGHTARDTMEALIGLVPLNGKVDGEGVVVDPGLRKLAELAAKSTESVRKATEHLEADGQIEILPPEDKGKPRRYRLLVPRATLDSMEGDTRGEGSLGGPPPGCQPLRAPTAPRLRWSSPSWARRREFELVPGRCVVRSTGASLHPEDREARSYVKRLGPHRGAVLDTLEAAGGELHLGDLCDALRRKRRRDLKRRILKPLEEAGIIECEGDVVRLVANWLAKLEEERERTGEIAQAEEQAEKHRKQRARYRERVEREKRGTPKASIDAVRRTEDIRKVRLREIRDEGERDRAPTPSAVEALVKKIMGQNERMRMGLLCAIALEEGLRWRDVPPAVRRMGYRTECFPEYADAEFIFAKEVAA